MNDPLRPAVAAYFEALDHLQPGSLPGDSESTAQQILAGLTRGDSSGFDQMTQRAEAARTRLAAITAPAPCAAFHRESLADFDESLQMLRMVRKAMNGGDADALLTGMTDRANAMRSRAEALQREEKALRQRYGLVK